MACMVFVAKGQIRHYKNEINYYFQKVISFLQNEIINFSFMQTLNFLEICHNIGYIHMKIFYVCDRWWHWTLWWDAAHPCLLVHTPWKKWPKFVRFFFKRGQNHFFQVKIWQNFSLKKKH
jgi:hypothetical protein